MKEFNCEVCPRHCLLQIDEHTEEVSGNNCLRGPVYARTQINSEDNPVRMVSTSVLCADGSRCYVFACEPVPKWKYFDIMKAVKRIRLAEPAESGTVLISNVCNTGIDIIAR